MSQNRYYTVLLVPEKTSVVRKFTLPAWVLKGASIGAGLLLLLAIIMVFDYAFVMSQIGQTRSLRSENRRLKQQVQAYKSKLGALESSMDRIKTFSNRLKVITNIEGSASLIQSYQQALPDASKNVGTVAPPIKSLHLPSEDAPENQGGRAEATPPEVEDVQLEAQIKNEMLSIENFFAGIVSEAHAMEAVLEDQYEQLIERKAFLSALPTLKPAVGYFTSGFGIRASPYGGRAKMHEGLDIANRPGSSIRAPADGLVSFAGPKPGYGQTLIIDHGYGLETWYGHTRKLLVTKGQKVRRGDTVAQLGSTGRSTGPHLHYEVRVNGMPVDPLTYILEN